MQDYYEIIKGLREDKDMTQTQIAKMLGTDQSYYAKYENGKHPIPINHLKTLCMIFGVSADYILGLPKGLKYPER